MLREGVQQMAAMTPLKRRRLEDPEKRTQEQVARELGIYPTYYTEIENGTKRCSLRLAARIAKYWGITIEEVISGFRLDDSSSDREVKPSA